MTINRNRCNRETTLPINSSMLYVGYAYGIICARFASGLPCILRAGQLLNFEHEVGNHFVLTYRPVTYVTVFIVFEILVWTSWQERHNWPDMSIPLYQVLQYIAVLLYTFNARYQVPGII